MAKSKESAAPAAAKSAPNGRTATQPIRNLYLVDGSGYLFRAYHALPPMTRPDGTPINAVYGFCRMLVADLLDKPEVDHVAMILDSSEVTFRNEIYDKYKANRPPPPDDLIPQFPLIREAAKAFNLTVCELNGYEADDLIATYARLAVEAGATCTIVSSDKDLMQLIRPGVEMMDPIKKTKIGPEAVMEKFGVAAGQGDRRAGAGRRFDRQRARRARHRRQDRRPADQRIRRPRDPADARRRDQAAQAARGAARTTPSWRASRRSWSRSGTTCPPPPSPRPSTSASPIPTCCCRGSSCRASRACCSASRANWARRPVPWRRRRHPRRPGRPSRSTRSRRHRPRPGPTSPSPPPTTS